MEAECARAFMHARDILRTVGITGFDATANIATLLTLRELEEQYARESRDAVRESAES